MATQTLWTTIQDLVDSGQTVSDSLDIAFGAVDSNATELGTTTTRSTDNASAITLLQSDISFTSANTADDPDTLTTVGAYLNTHANLPFSNTESVINVIINSNSGKLWQFVEPTVEDDKYGYRVQDTTVGTWLSWNQTTYGSSPSALVFEDLTGSEPSYLANQVFMGDGVLNVDGKFTDDRLRVGERLPVEVVNTTGVELNELEIIRFNTVVSGTPAPVLAQADSFNNASNIAMVGLPIGDGELGRVTRYGIVRNVDTTAFAAGARLYLSDTVAGGMQITPPSNGVITLVGFVLVSHDTLGEIFVSPDANIALPTIYGNMRNGVLPATMTQNVDYFVDNYTIESGSFMATNLVAGLISVAINGEYKLGVTGIFRYTQIGNAEQELAISIESNDGLDVHDGAIALPRNSTFVTASFTTQRHLIAGKDYRIRVTSLDSTLTLVTANIEFNITSVKLDT